MGKTTLVNFIKFLEDKDLMRFEMIRDGDAQFSNRFRIQKYVLLAQRLGAQSAIRIQHLLLRALFHADHRRLP